MSQNFIEICLSLLVLGSTCLILILLSNSRRGYLLPLLFGFSLRVIASLINRFVVTLPMGGTDAVAFERRAWIWSQSGCGGLMDHLNLGASYVHSWIVGNIYACTDRAPLAFQSINVFLGMATVYLVGRIAEALWDREAGIRATWVAALFPLFIINSAVPLREVWFTTFFLLGILLIVRWAHRRKIFYLITSIASILLAGIFHGSAIFAIAGIGLMLLGWFFKTLLTATLTGKVSGGLVSGGIVMALGVTLALGIGSQLRFSSVGEVAALDERAERLGETSAAARGGSAYPSYVVPSNFGETLLLTPIRAFYALTGPPPWEVRSAYHILGALDGLIYLALMIIIGRHWRKWWHRPEFRLLIVIFFIISIILAWGTNNFGTAMRHRAKFIGILIAMGAGFLGRKGWQKQRKFHSQS